MTEPSRVLTPAIRVEHLTKAFGRTDAVNDISFDVPRGEIFALLGPHGSGKSTTIKMLCTLTRPTGGLVRVVGFDAVTRPREVRRRIGLVLRDQPCDTDMTAQESLRFHAVLYGVEPVDMQHRIATLLGLVGLADRADDRVATFDVAPAKRLEIARALLNAPDVLFLDEPTVGWDVRDRALMWRDVRKLSDLQDVAVFVTTRYLDEAEFADRIAIMDAGRIVAAGGIAELKGVVSADTVDIATTDDSQALAELARAGFTVTPTPDGLRVETAGVAGAIARIIHGTSVAIHKMHVRQPTLDDVLAHYMGRATLGDEETDRLTRAPQAVRRDQG